MQEQERRPIDMEPESELAVDENDPLYADFKSIFDRFLPVEAVRLLFLLVLPVPRGSGC